MLAEECLAIILPILQKQRVVTVLELAQAPSIGESIIQRDPAALHKMGKLKKVHGGITLLHKECGLCEIGVAVRGEGHVEEEKQIARYVVSLVQTHDFVYINAGSTTPCMMERLKEEEAVYMTNGLGHGRQLIAQGFRILPLAGELKNKMEAVVGLGAASSLQKYNFNKAFFGTNGITMDSGFTTPNTNEAYIKMGAMKHTQKCHVFAGSGKFGTCISITTANISDAMIITDKGTEREYLEEADIIEVEE